MAIFGDLELQFFQLTPSGLARVQSGVFPERVDPTSRWVLQQFVELGGTAEWDELTMQSGANPNTVRVALRRLIDLGYVAPVAVEPAAS